MKSIQAQEKAEDLVHKSNKSVVFVQICDRIRILMSIHLAESGPCLVPELTLIEGRHKKLELNIIESRSCNRG